MKSDVIGLFDPNWNWKTTLKANKESRVSHEFSMPVHMDHFQALNKSISDLALESWHDYPKIFWKWLSI